MAKDDTLFTRRAEQEIDEALAWLETIGRDHDDDEKRVPASRKNAYEVLPTWLKMDLSSDAKSAPPVDAPKIQNDNLSWLDSIASGLGGPIEEPPTMSWEETAIYQVSEEDRARALSDAASKVENRMSGEVIDDAMAGAALEAAQQLDQTSQPNDEPTQIGLRPVSTETEDKAAFPLSDEELTQIYEQVERDFADESYAFHDALSLSPEKAAEEPASPAVEDVSDSVLLERLGLNDSISAESDLPDVPSVDPDSTADLPSIEELANASALPDLFPILAEEGEPSKSEGMQHADFDDIEALAADIFADDDAPSLPPVEPTAALEEGRTEVYLPDDPMQSASNIIDSILGDEAVDLPDLDSAESLTQIAPTEIYLPKATSDSETPPVDQLASELTEIFLPDEGSNFEAPLPSLDELQSLDSAPSQEALTEIFLPDADALRGIPEDHATEPLEMGADAVGESLPSLGQAEPTQVFEQVDGELADLNGLTPNLPVPADDADDFTQVYLPEQLEPQDEALAAPSSAESIEPVPAASSESLTEIYLPEFGDVTGETPVDILSASEPTQLQEPLDADEPPLPAPSEPTVISEVPISERWKSLAARDEEQSEAIEQADLVDHLKQTAAETQSEPTASKANANIADAIPEDPDEAMAWLEKMARQQQVQGIEETIAASVKPKEPADVPSDLPSVDAMEALSAQNPDWPYENTDALVTIEAPGIESLLKQQAEIEPQDDDFRDVLVEANTSDDADGDSVAASAPTRYDEPADIDASLASMMGDIEAEPLPASHLDEQRSNALSEQVDEHELGDALAWLEDVATNDDSSVDEMTVELDQEDVARLLEEHLSSKSESSVAIAESPVDENLPLDADQPTLITEMPDLGAALDVPHLDGFDQSDELDEALAWLEAFATEDSSAGRPGDLAAQALAQSETDDATVTPRFEPERIAARKAFDSADFATIFNIYSDILSQDDALGADVVARDTRAWIKQHPNQPVLHQLMGEAHLKLGQYEQAAMAFKRALVLR